jgi:hypothetical protein
MAVLAELVMTIGAIVLVAVRLEPAEAQAVNVRLMLITTNKK